MKTLVENSPFGAAIKILFRIGVLVGTALLMGKALQLMQPIPLYLSSVFIDFVLFGLLSVCFWHLFVKNPGKGVMRRIVLFAMGSIFYIPFGASVVSLCGHFIVGGAGLGDAYQLDSSLFFERFPTLLVFSFAGVFTSLGIYACLAWLAAEPPTQNNIENSETNNDYQ